MMNQQLIDKQQANLKKYQVINDYYSGKSKHEISRNLHMDRKQVRRITSKFEEYGSVEEDRRKINSGRKKVFDDDFKEKAKSVIMKLEDKRVRNVQLELEKQLKTEISLASTQRILKSVGDFRSIEQRVILLDKHKSDRLQYCSERTKKGLFRNLIFTDESRFFLNRNTKKVFVFHGERIPFKNKQNPDYSIMIWGSVCFRGKVNMQFVEGCLDQQKYIAILNNFLPKANEMYQKQSWHFVQDNAPAHKAKKVIEYLEQKNVSIIKHPANSPDLNPIEQIWSVMKSDVERQNPQNLSELKECITQAWDNLDLETVKNCVVHLPYVMKQIIENEGDYVFCINKKNSQQNI